MLRRGGRALASAVALVSIGSRPYAADALRVCGHAAASPTQLYFEVAKRWDASVLRADERETILETRTDGALWIFVARPVSAVLCRRAGAPTVESVCTGGSDALCATVVARLTADPRSPP